MSLQASIILKVVTSHPDCGVFPSWTLIVFPPQIFLSAELRSRFGLDKFRTNLDVVLSALLEDLVSLMH